MIRRASALSGKLPLGAIDMLLKARELLSIDENTLSSGDSSIYCTSTGSCLTKPEAICWNKNMFCTYPMAGNMRNPRRTGIQILGSLMRSLTSFSIRGLSIKLTLRLV